MTDEKLTTAQAANRAGVATSTWSAYVSRGQAPKADGRHDLRTPWWLASTVDTWLADRRRPHLDDPDRRR